MVPWAQFIVFVVILAFSGISWAIRKLAEQQQKKAALDRADRNREEYLRTGRDPSAPAGNADDAQARLKELASRRQAQLKALRGQKGAGPGASGSGQASGAEPVRTELWPGGPVIEVAPKAPKVSKSAAPEPGRTAPPPPSPVYKAPAQQPAPKVRPPKSAKARPSAAPVPAQAFRQTMASTVPTQRSRQVESGMMGPVSPPPPRVFIPPSTPDQWRAALIAGEVLSKPIALRSPEELAG